MRVVQRLVVTEEKGVRREKPAGEVVTVLLTLQASKLNVHLLLEHRQKGLMWYSTCRCSVRWRLHVGGSGESGAVRVQFPYPAHDRCMTT